MSQVAHQAGAYPGFCSVKRIGVFLLPPGRDASIGVWAPVALGGGDFLAQKIYAMPECKSVEIGMQTHSNCMKNKNVHNSHIL